jgi:O-antigen/teichoic acid export membrane protein
LNSIKKLVSQFAVYGMSNIVGRFLNFLLVPLYTGIFDPAEYGISVQLYAYVTFFNVLLTYGMETTFFRFASKQNNQEQVYTTGMISILFSSTLFLLVASFFVPAIAQAVKLQEHPEYIEIFIWILALDAIASLPFAYLRQHNKAVRFAFIKNLNIMINIGLNVYFFILAPFLHQKGLNILFYNANVGIGYIFISNLAASVITLLMFVPELNYVRKGKFDQALWKKMMVYALPMMIVGFAGMINETLDRVMITWFYPDAEIGRTMNGIYGANYKMAMLMALFIQAFRYAAEPFFFAHAGQSDKRDIYARVMNYFVAGTLLMFLFVMQYLDVIAGLFLRNKSFHSGLHVVAPLLMANVFLGIYYNLSVWYKVTDNTKKGAVISLIGACITVLLNLWWIPIFGYTGAAYTTLACYSIMSIICYVWGQKYFKVPYQAGRIVAYIMLALMLHITSHYFMQSVSQLGMFALRVYQFLPLLIFGLIVWRFESIQKSLISHD